MSSREDRVQAVAGAGEKWTLPTLARELLLILSASAGIIALLMLLKGLQSIV